MIKNITSLQVKIGERLYKLFCDVDSPIGEVHDALCQMKGFIVTRINEAHNAEKKESPEELEVEIIKQEAQ